MNDTNDLITNIPDCEIENKRKLNVAKEIVFKAFAEPDHLKNWWGPKGFSNTFHEFDLRPNGKWRFTMHGPDKGNYLNECVFITISPELIAWQRISNPIFKVVVLFEQLSKETTEIIFKMIFDNKEDCNKIRKFAPEKNEENFDRLEDELKKMI